MKKLAHTQVAVCHEDLNLPSKLRAFRNIKLKALKVVKLIAIAAGGITTSLVLGTTSLASTNPNRNITATNVAWVEPTHTRNQEKDTKGSESYTPITQIKKEAPSGQRNKEDLKGTARSIDVGGNTEKEHARNPGKVRYGRLTLVNDTPSPKLIYLIPPKSAIPKRYAYVLGCTYRQLTMEYSTGWRFTTDMETKATLIDVSRDGQIEARASRLSKAGGGRCVARQEIQSIRTASATAIPYRGAQWNHEQVLYGGLPYDNNENRRLLDTLRKMVKYINDPSGFLQKYDPTLPGSQNQDPLYMWFYQQVYRVCNQGCEVNEKNTLLTAYLDQATTNARKKMINEVYQAGVTIYRTPEEHMSAVNNFVDAILQAATVDEITPAEARYFLQSYFTSTCPGQRYNIVEGLVDDWNTYRAANRIVKNAILPMSPTGNLYAGPIVGPQRPPDLQQTLEMNRPCRVNEPARSHHDKVVSYKPGMQ